jgi:hypothetical protein
MDQDQDRQENKRRNCNRYPRLERKGTNKEKARQSYGDDASVLEGRQDKPGALIGRVVPQDAAAITSRVLCQAQEGKEGKKTEQY